ncbi:ArsC family reductase [Pedobacter sp. SYSU D00535]|uniref:ArsC family reductase n=1 Tax=Pedobacter sp. SYSU D00535 TaxID=2810308 RepID=UPI001A95B4DF|nr:ArsC family reductase [Pedobacter sp. SYSU D00535]
MKVYGIKNCDTVKKVLNWLNENKVEYEFHDFKKLGISEEKLEEWNAKLGWESLLNKKGTTWKKLDPEAQNSVVDARSAYQLMMDKTSVIKRPVVEKGEALVLGFNPDALENLVR